jgi:hypothetical protein
MAAGYLPLPGTTYGPCIADCAHIDCAATRSDAAQVCHLCKTSIGYDRGYYSERTTQTPVRRLVHASCLEQEVRQQHQEWGN